MNETKFPENLNKYIKNDKNEPNILALSMAGILLVIYGLLMTPYNKINTVCLFIGIFCFLILLLSSYIEEARILPPEAIIDISNVEWSEPAKAKLQEIVSIKAEKLKLKDLRKILKTEEEYQKYQEEIKENEKVKEAISNIMK